MGVGGKEVRNGQSRCFFASLKGTLVTKSQLHMVSSTVFYVAEVLISSQFTVSTKFSMERIQNVIYT